MRTTQHGFHFRLLSVSLFFFSFLNVVHAQHDSLIMKNGDVIVGEIKSMDRGVVTIETGYSKNDFTVKWGGIRKIFSQHIFMVTLEDGRKINGHLQSSDEEGKVIIKQLDNQQVQTSMTDIVYMKGVKTDFKSRLSASVDAGLSFSKANNLQQLTINSSVGYTADKWMLDVYYTMVKSSQENVATTKRIDAGTNYKYSLRRHWFLAASINFLSNTEQALNLRSIGKLGAGNYLIYTTRSYWALSAGFSYNNESFTNGTEGRNSAEAYAGTELNLFDIGDLSFFNSIYVYPSLTESGRWRADFKLDTKYDLPLDFYIKAGLTFNYDNKPAVTGNETDYVLFFSIGWHL
jgi:hypothetical protein